MHPFLLPSSSLTVGHKRDQYNLNEIMMKLMSYSAFNHFTNLFPKSNKTNGTISWLKAQRVQRWKTTTHIMGWLYNRPLFHRKQCVVLCNLKPGYYLFSLGSPTSDLSGHHSHFVPPASTLQFMIHQATSAGHVESQSFGVTFVWWIEVPLVIESQIVNTCHPRLECSPVTWHCLWHMTYVCMPWLWSQD